ncbi:MAG TPA: hypothetical protein VD793_07940 [Gemmatimonadales bacterium]|nr:hypothetical protein [Gemmatimonadales bacterium]
MITPSPFDHRPDPEIGDALRELLSSPGDAALVARILGASQPLYGGALAGWWVVLDRWARPGVAAAGTLVAAATLWMFLASSPVDADVTIEDAVRLAGEAVAAPVLVAATTEPELERLMWDAPDPE